MKEVLPHYTMRIGVIRHKLRHGLNGHISASYIIVGRGLGLLEKIHEVIWRDARLSRDLKSSLWEHSVWGYINKWKTLSPYLEEKEGDSKSEVDVCAD